MFWAPYVVSSLCKAWLLVELQQLVPWLVVRCFLVVVVVGGGGGDVCCC